MYGTRVKKVVIRIRMLNPGQTLRCLHHAPQAVIIKLVGSSASSASAKSRTHRDRVVLFRDVLMNDVVGKAGQRRFAAIDENFDLVGRRRPGKALVFIIDEVGQHVARSGDKIEDLRATIEEFGKVGKNLLTARKIPAPCWIVVTSQEKLDEVVAALDSKRVELAKLQDRFHYRVDLAPSDIREVATKRVLAKKTSVRRASC